MNSGKLAITMILIIICAGCRLQTEDVNETSRYVNEEYHFEITFPDEWIGRVAHVWNQAHSAVSFYYSEIPDNQAKIVSISVKKLEDWEEEITKSGCCGASEIARTDQYAYIENIVLDMPFMCGTDGDMIANCEEKEQEYLKLVRAFDVNKHFQLID